VYEGEWQKDKKHGRGKKFSANGTLEYDGLWEDDKRKV